MPTWVTPFSSSHARNAARSWRMVPKLRTSLVGRRPAAPRMTQATTEPWCTSSPAARSISASMATSRGGGRGAAGRKTEAGPRADRTDRSRPSVVPERGADRSLVRGRMPPTHHRPPRVRHPTCWRGGTLVHPGPIFSSEAVRGMRWASLVHGALVHGAGVGQHQLVQLAEAVGDLPALEVDDELAFFHVDPAHDAEVA